MAWRSSMRRSEARGRSAFIGLASRASELLDAVVEFVRNEDVAVRVHRYVHGPTKLPGRTAEASPHRNEHAIVVELLDPVVARVTNEDVASPVNGEEVREHELPAVAPHASPRPDERPVVGELLDAVVEGVSNEDVSIQVHCDTKGVVE